jgi:hypothetical protein
VARTSSAPCKSFPALFPISSLTPATHQSPQLPPFSFAGIAARRWVEACGDVYARWRALAAAGLRCEERCAVPIAVDSQPAILATQGRAPNPSHWIWDVWHGLARAFQQRHPDARITIRWAPGHVGIAGNERVDEEARRAAQDPDSSDQRAIPISLRGSLPWSRSAVQQALNTMRKSGYEKQWGRSTRYLRTAQYDARLLKGSYPDLADTLPRSHAVFLLQLRTGPSRWQNTSTEYAAQTRLSALAVDRRMSPSRTSCCTALSTSVPARSCTAPSAPTHMSSKSS